MSGAGDRIVALESSDPGGLPLRPHASVVVRDAASGTVSGATSHAERDVWCQLAGI